MSTTIEHIARETAGRAILTGTSTDADADTLAAIIADGIRAHIAYGRITSDEDYRYTPVIGSRSVGYLVTTPTGRTESVILVPSTATGEGPGHGNVFLYWSDDATIDVLGDAQTHLAFEDTTEPDTPPTATPVTPKRTVRITVEIPPVQAEFITWGHIRHWIDQNTPSNARLLVRTLTGSGMITWGDYANGYAQGTIRVDESRP